MSNNKRTNRQSKVQLTTPPSRSRAPSISPSPKKNSTAISATISPKASGNLNEIPRSPSKRQSSKSKLTVDSRGKPRSNVVVKKSLQASERMLQIFNTQSSKVETLQQVSEILAQPQPRQSFNFLKRRNISKDPEMPKPIILNGPTVRGSKSSDDKVKISTLMHTKSKLGATAAQAEDAHEMSALRKLEAAEEERAKADAKPSWGKIGEEDEAADDDEEGDDFDDPARDNRKLYYTIDEVKGRSRNLFKPGEGQVHVDVLCERKKKKLLDKVFGMKLDNMLFWVRKMKRDMEIAKLKAQIEKERMERQKREKAEKELIKKKRAQLDMRKSQITALKTDAKLKMGKSKSKLFELKAASFNNQSIQSDSETDQPPPKPKKRMMRRMASTSNTPLLSPGSLGKNSSVSPSIKSSPEHIAVKQPVSNFMKTQRTIRPKSYNSTQNLLPFKFASHQVEKSAAPTLKMQTIQEEDASGEAPLNLRLNTGFEQRMNLRKLKSNLIMETVTEEEQNMDIPDEYDKYISEIMPKPDIQKIIKKRSSMIIDAQNVTPRQSKKQFSLKNLDLNMPDSDDSVSSSSLTDAQKTMDKVNDEKAKPKVTVEPIDQIKGQHAVKLSNQELTQFKMGRSLSLPMDQNESIKNRLAQKAVSTFQSQDIKKVEVDEDVANKPLSPVKPQQESHSGMLKQSATLNMFNFYQQQKGKMGGDIPKSALLPSKPKTRREQIGNMPFRETQRNKDNGADGSSSSSCTFSEKVRRADDRMRKHDEKTSHLKEVKTQKIGNIIALNKQIVRETSRFNQLLNLNNAFKDKECESTPTNKSSKRPEPVSAAVAFKRKLDIVKAPAADQTKTLGTPKPWEQRAKLQRLMTGNFSQEKLSKRLTNKDIDLQSSVKRLSPNKKASSQRVLLSPKAPVKLLKSQVSAVLPGSYSPDKLEVKKEPQTSMSAKTVQLAIANFMRNSLQAMGSATRRRATLAIIQTTNIQRCKKVQRMTSADKVKSPTKRPDSDESVSGSSTSSIKTDSSARQSFCDHEEPLRQVSKQVAAPASNTTNSLGGIFQSMVRGEGKPLELGQVDELESLGDSTSGVPTKQFNSPQHPGPSAPKMQEQSPVLFKEKKSSLQLRRVKQRDSGADSLPKDGDVVKAKRQTSDMLSDSLITIGQEDKSEGSGKDRTVDADKKAEETVRTEARKRSNDPMAGLLAMRLQHLQAKYEAIDKKQPVSEKKVQRRVNKIKKFCETMKAKRSIIALSSPDKQEAIQAQAVKVKLKSTISNNRGSTKPTVLKMSTKHFRITTAHKNLNDSLIGKKRVSVQTFSPDQLLIQSSKENLSMSMTRSPMTEQRLAEPTPSKKRELSMGTLDASAIYGSNTQRSLKSPAADNERQGLLKLPVMRRSRNSRPCTGNLTTSGGGTIFTQVQLKSAHLNRRRLVQQRASKINEDVHAISPQLDNSDSNTSFKPFIENGYVNSQTMQRLILPNDSVDTLITSRSEFSPVQSGYTTQRQLMVPTPRSKAHNLLKGPPAHDIHSEIVPVQSLIRADDLLTEQDDEQMRTLQKRIIQRQLLRRQQYKQQRQQTQKIFANAARRSRQPGHTANHFFGSQATACVLEEWPVNGSEQGFWTRRTMRDHSASRDSQVMTAGEATTDFNGTTMATPSLIETNQSVQKSNVTKVSSLLASNRRMMVPRIMNIDA